MSNEHEIEVESRIDEEDQQGSDDPMFDRVSECRLRVLDWNRAAGKGEVDFAQQMRIFIEEVFEVDQEEVGSAEWLSEVADVFVTVAPFSVNTDQYENKLGIRIAETSWNLAVEVLYQVPGAIDILEATLDNNDSKFYTRTEFEVAQHDAEWYRAEKGIEVNVHQLLSNVRDEYDGGYCLKNANGKVLKPLNFQGFDAQRILELAQMENNSGDDSTGAEEIS